MTTTLNNNSSGETKGEQWDSQVYIHVGLHRTGTTFLQREVFPNLQTTQYLDNLDVNYWLRRLVSEEDSAYEASAYEDYFTTAVDSRPSLISYEGLSGEPFLMYVNQTRNADRLAAIFPNATIILGIRRQDTLLLSLYLLFIMHGGSMSLSAFLGYNKGKFSKRISLYGRRVNLPMFEFGHIADLYEDRFPGRVRFLVSEHMSRDISGYVRNLCNILGEHEIPDFRTGVRNQAYGYYQYLLARLLNPLASSFMNPDGLIPAVGLPGRVRHPMNHLLRHDAVNRLFSSWPKNRIRMPKKMSLEIMKHYSASNAALDEKWDLGLQELGYIPGGSETQVNAVAAPGA